ncbi:hypothetical protein EV191_1011346 [Tamaricihabitans halophyticus]|uniref:Uncharacterized protein n=1 Tax=Tamaricihabitans halophyticus TaxID=1262583 RepID=A0A4R2RCD6_9PSEU|nr:hypothetical protein [Tamaricihabitans halophyticus]TCP57391.1 hypothetical protein EV191_1011346 [Tamaricihabitans halophyticus]
MPEFRSRPDGSKYPITPRKGGTIVAAAALGGVVAVSSGVGGFGTGAAGGNATGAAESVLSPALRAKTTKASDFTKRNQPKRAWRQLGLRTLRDQLHEAASCVAYSYGQVQNFLQRTPCRELDRMLLPLVDADGNRLNVAVAWVRMPTRGSARELRALTDTDGTGNIAPIGSTGPSLAGTELTGEHYASRRSGSRTVIAEAASSDPAVSSAILQATTEVAVYLPPP